MAIDITNHKCPACTGPLHYVGSSGMLECDYCGSKYTVEEIEKLYAEDVAKAEDGFAKNEAKKDGLIDQFIYGSISATYLADIVDSL